MFQIEVFIDVTVIIESVDVSLLCHVKRTWRQFCVPNRRFVCPCRKYSDTSANKDNSFRNHIR